MNVAFKPIFAFATRIQCKIRIDKQLVQFEGVTLFVCVFVCFGKLTVSNYNMNNWTRVDLELFYCGVF